MVGLVPFHLIFLSRLVLLRDHVHLLLPIALQKSGSQESKRFRITGLGYEENKCKLCKFKCLLNVTIAFAVHNSDWKGRQLGNTISIWNAWKLELILLARWPRETHILQKKFTEVQYIKRAFKLILVCMCMLMGMCFVMCMISSLPAWPKCQGWVVVALPAQGQAHPQQLSPSSLASLAPCWELLWFLPAPASVQFSLHQLPAERPNFNALLSLSMLFIVFQSGRLFSASNHDRLLLLP